MKSDEQINRERIHQQLETAKNNAALLRRCGWVRVRVLAPGPYVVGVRERAEEGLPLEPVRSSPYTSRDAFHDHVVPVLRERGLLNKWSKIVADFLSISVVADSNEECPWPAVDLDDDGGEFLTAPPRILCEAAIAVLEGNNDEQD